MAGRGFAPAADQSKLKGHRKPREVTELRVRETKKKVRTLPGAQRYLKETRDWWKTWKDSEQSEHFLETDWKRLEMLADLVDDFYRADSLADRVAAHREVRLEESKFGATVDDRLRLSMRLVKDPPKKAEDDQPARRGRGTRRDPRLSVLEGGKPK